MSSSALAPGSPAFIGLVVDTARSMFVFAQWTILGTLVDRAMGGTTTARKVAVVYLFVSTWAMNLYSLGRSYMALGRGGRGSEYTETILGLFFEIVTIMQGFGISWCLVRIFTLDGMTTYGQPFWDQTFLSQLGNSIFEMSLVLAGVGWAATPPTTLGEKLVAWLTATVGGILIVNLFLVSVVMGRRGWWERV